MKNIATKSNNISSLTAEEFNNLQQCHENSVTTSGQTLNEFNLHQQSEAMARYSATGATFYQDSGTADNYVLGALGSFIAPAVYLDGALAVFKIGNDSTGPSTINYNGIGNKNLTLPDGAAISTEMIAGEYATTRFNEAADRVELADVSQSVAEGSLLPAGYFTGFTKTNGADADHDYDFLAGSCRDGTDIVNITTGALTKQFDASWVTGTGNGGLSSSLTLTVDTWYHIHGIVVGGVADIAADTDINAANLIADHSVTAYRHLWSFLTDGSANILPSLQNGDIEIWQTAANDLNDGSTRAANLTLSSPLGYATEATIRIYAERSSNNTTVTVRPVYVTTTTAHIILDGSANRQSLQRGMVTNPSSEIYVEINLALTTCIVETEGWRYIREAM